MILEDYGRFISGHAKDTTLLAMKLPLLPGSNQGPFAEKRYYWHL